MAEGVLGNGTILAVSSDGHTCSARSLRLAGSGLRAESAA